MKKILNFLLINLALSVLASPVYAKFGGSVRGDVGALGSQVPYFIIEHGVSGVNPVDTTTFLSRRAKDQWEFTGRLFVYTSCAPCATYIAGSWQGSNHTVHSCKEVESVRNFSDENLQPLISLRVVNPFGSFVNGVALLLPFNGVPVASKIAVTNKFSKAKLGLGFDLIKTQCFSFTMEVGGNYLDAQLHTDQDYLITQTVENGPGLILLPPFSAAIFSADTNNLPFDYVVNEDICQKTEGVGLYASFRADYKFPSTCLGNCFGLYAKAEVADIIGRQKYNGRVCYTNEFDVVHNPIPLQVFDYEEHICNRYNNVVEVDLEAALVYSPCFKCWNNLNLNFSLGVRTDSFVNLFSMPVEYIDVSYFSLTRPTVFFEVGVKV